MQNILLNILPFKPIHSILNFNFQETKPEGIYATIYWDKLFETFPIDRNPEEKSYYCSFANSKENTFSKEINLYECPQFAQQYFRFLIFNFLKDKVDIIMPNFIKDIEVWMLDNSQSTEQFKSYLKFTIKVQYAKVSPYFELVIAFDGKAKILNKSLQDIGTIDTNLFNWMNCDGKLFKYEFMPPELLNNMETIFPVLNVPLKKYFQIPFDEIIFENRYPKYLKLMNHFATKMFFNKDFNKIIQLVKNDFWQINPQKINQTSQSSNELIFGNNQFNINPFVGIKNNGPYKPSNHKNVKFFFIYHPEDKYLAVKNIYNYFKNGFIKNDSKKMLFPNLVNFIKLPLELAIDKNIEIKNYDNIFNEISDAISNAPYTPNTQFVAIYISPFPKTEENEDRHQVYFKVKELLLNYDITSQVLFRDNILKKDFNYFLPNIEIALLAKLGGIPWRLNCSKVDELIVGVGAFYSHTIKKRFVGSAFCFNNEGVFQGFECFKADDTIMLAGSIRHAVQQYQKQNKEAKRLIIHFYKQISKKELTPILQALDNLELDIPVIIVTINKTDSKELLGFDTNNTTLIPMSGTFIKVGYNEYLLFNNTRYYKDSILKPKEFNFPIKLKLSSTHPDLLKDNSLVTTLMDQVYQFSRMYWKSVSQQNLPVTILYPEMVAEIFPHFDSDVLPQFAKNNLWFL